MSDDEDSTSLRAELSRERSALLQKILLAKGNNNSSNSTSNQQKKALLRSAVVLKTPPDTGVAKPFHRRSSFGQKKPQPESAVNNEALTTTSTPNLTSSQKKPLASSTSKPPELALAAPAITYGGGGGAHSPPRRRNSLQDYSNNRQGSSTGSAPRQTASNGSDPSSSTSGGAFRAQAARKQSIVKAAQIFGDPRVVQGGPKSLNEVDPSEDLRVKVLADQQFVAEREQAKQQKMREVLQAQPTAEQLSLPEAQKQHRTSVKALQLLGSQDLEKQMQQNVGGLPYDPKKPQNKATRVLGSVSVLGQPKLEKVLGSSSDAEDAHARNKARSAWDQEVKDRTSLKSSSIHQPQVTAAAAASRVLRSFGSASSSASAATTVTKVPPAAAQQERKPTSVNFLTNRPQPFPLELSSTEVKEDEQQTSSSTTRNALGLLGASQRKPTQLPSSSSSSTNDKRNYDDEIRRRKSLEETAELISLMDRFSAKKL